LADRDKAVVQYYIFLRIEQSEQKPSDAGSKISRKTINSSVYCGAYNGRTEMHIEWGM